MSEQDDNSVAIDVDEENDGSGDDEASNTSKADAGDTDSVDSRSKTVPPSATSKKSNLSRKGSAKSQKSVVWSTGASSEKELIDEKSNETKKGMSVLEIISGKLLRNIFILFIKFYK